MLESGRHNDKAEAFARQLEAYLAATLHDAIQLAPWDKGARLPVFLDQRYTFYRAAIAHQPCLFMATLAPLEATPAEIAKHMALVTPAFEGIVIYAGPHMTATLRARLLAQGTPFAVPGNQLYIPQLATDLREHFRAPDRVRGDALSPVAQVVLFHQLLQPHYKQATPSALVDRLRYSAMSIGRAFDELGMRELARVEKIGREKVLTFLDPPRTVFDRAKAALRSPVRGIHAVRFTQGVPPLLVAGETALAERTNLATRALPTYAIAATDWQGVFRENGIADYNYEYEGEALIETWRYDPHLLSHEGTVDPLSLYARYWNDPDERVAQAAEALLDAITW